MTARARHAAAGAIGLALVAAHVVAFFALLRCARRQPLRVTVAAPLAADQPDVRATWPPELDGRVRVDHIGAARGPGMHRTEWRVRYRGGFERRVGVTQLVGPRQDPGAAPCAIRVILGQRLLDTGDPRGDAHPGTLAAVVAARIDEQLAGVEAWPLGGFRRVERVRMRWVRLADIDNPRRERAVRRAAARDSREPGGSGPVDEPAGIVRVTLSLRFDDGLVPLWIAVIPRVTARGLRVATHVEAGLELDSRIYQLIADLLDADDIATTAARRELDAALASALALPPIDLPGGRSLRVAFCPGRPIDIITGQHAAVPLRLVPSGAGEPAVRGDQPKIQPPAPAEVGPVWLGSPARRVRTVTDAPVAIEFELDAINAILHALWRAGAFDAALARAGARFNRDPRVRDLLSVRLSDLRLTLPPTVWQRRAATPGLRLGIEAAVTLRDRDAATPAHLFGHVGIDLVATSDPRIIAELILDDLVLTCEPEPGVLAPCYSDLVRAVRHRAGDLHGALSERFAELYSELVLDRRIELAAPGIAFGIDRARVRLVDAEPAGMIRVNLYGALRPAPE